MKRKKILLLTVITTLTIFLSVGCTNKEMVNSTSPSSETDVKSVDAKKEKTKISAYIGGGDTSDAIDKVVEDFNKQSETTIAEVVPLPAGQSGYQLLTVMYNAGNPPALISLESDAMKKITDKLLPVETLDCVKFAAPGTLDDGTFDNKLLGVPYGRVEAFGLIYNLDTLKKTLGEEFDVDTIKTVDGLREAFEKIKEKGVTPIVIGPQDWSIGNHYFSEVYTGQSQDRDEKATFVDKLRSGEEKLVDNKIYNEVMDVFDLFKEFNYYKGNPLEYAASGLDKQAQLLATGEVAFWFQGNWASNTITTLDEVGNYGMMSIPYGNEVDKYPNSLITTLIPTYLCIENTVTSPEQQASAKELIEYLVQSQRGQEFIVNELKGIPAYTNYKIELTDDLAISVNNALGKNMTKAMYSDLGAEHYSDVGSAMQKYLDGQIDRVVLASEVEKYWSTH